MARILVVDDEARLAEVAAVALEQHGFEAEAVSRVEQAVERLDEGGIDLVLTDLRMPGMTGAELLQYVRKTRGDLPVIIMTAYASVRDAVQLVKEGAFDYISKPFEIDDVVATIQRALKLREVEAEASRLREELGVRYDFNELIGESPSFHAALRQITEVCASRATVLLQGESGTGKELVARAIHFNSPRSRKSFVAVNCAAIPEALLESELFGHVKGAFTGAITNREGRFQAADGGTLFLDEIGDMPMALQAKVLRAIQEQTFEPVGATKSVQVDVRFVAATHKNLRQEAQDGNFREDLFYRLNVFPIHIPSLRERPGDVPLLANHFLARQTQDMGKRIERFTPAALRAMEAYDWPGNIRELQNCVERSVIVAHGSEIDVTDLPPYIFDSPQTVPGKRSVPPDLDAELERLERDFITEALRENGGVQARAAERLGISERSFWHRVKKLGITIKRHVE
ncbi:MAG: sigma-54 dependent transcriptional regulator [Rhodospirillaceae bacterium]|nr:sigma-54 dependent transcriptional regulator [Rhodospirillaceae bacterium]